MPTLSSADARVAEGAEATAPARFVLTLSARAAQDVTLRARTQDATARAREDYVAVDTVVTIPAGQDSAIVDVPVLGDTTPEPDRTLGLVLSDVTGAALLDGRDTYTATILDDDHATTPAPAPSKTPAG